jgi:hypothetical protein
MTDSLDFREDGIAFVYPADWEISRERKGGELSITLAGAGTAFATIVVLFDRPGAEEVIETAVDAFREDYPDLDVHTTRAQLCDLPTLARDLEFFCHELTNTARLRAFDTERCTVLLLCQTNDGELSDAEPVFDQLAKTLSINEGEMGFDEDEEED